MTRSPVRAALVLLSTAALLAPLTASALVAPGAAPGPSATETGHAGDAVPPVGTVEAPGVLTPFDPPTERWLAGHRGVDLAAAPGAPVRSPAPGVVTFAGPVAGRDVVVVAHDDGLRTSLEPVTATVARGVRVSAGEEVGTVQNIGGSDGTTTRASHCAGGCVHWGVRRGDTYVDPLALLGPAPPIVLLPLGARR